MSKIDNPITLKLSSVSRETVPIVQLLNKFALMNENISAEMIDGGLFQGEIESKRYKVYLRLSQW